MKFGIIKIITLIGLFSTTACQFADEEKMKAKYAPPAKSIFIANENYVQSINIEPVGEELNRFKVVAKFNPKKSEDLSYKFKVGDVSMEKIIPTAQMILELQVKGGDKFDLQINKGSDLIALKSEVVLEDRLVEGVLELKEDLTANYYRFILKSKAAIITNGKDLVIKAHIIEAEDGATIMSFPQGQRAELGKVGRNGGTIVLNAKFGFGKLLIQGLGERGGNGQNGKLHAQTRAKNGANGRDAKENCISRMVGFPSCTCEGNAKPGGNGANGLNGNNGSDGLAGGNSAILRVSIDYNDLLEVVPVIYGGSGGEGGLAGLAQLGGAGGNRGRGVRSCNDPGSNGNPGADGLPGNSGLKGSDGITHDFCLIIGDRVSHCQRKDLEKAKSTVSTLRQ